MLQNILINLKNWEYSSQTNCFVPGALLSRGAWGILKRFEAATPPKFYFTASIAYLCHAISFPFIIVYSTTIRMWFANHLPKTIVNIPISHFYQNYTLWVKWHSFTKIHTIKIKNLHTLKIGTNLNTHTHYIFKHMLLTLEKHKNAINLPFLAAKMWKCIKALEHLNHLSFNIPT